VVWAKSLSLAGAVLGITACFLALSPFLLVLPVATLAAGYVYFRRLRIHPSAEEYYELQNVRFGSLGEESQLALFDSNTSMLPEPEALLNQEN